MKFSLVISPNVMSSTLWYIIKPKTHRVADILAFCIFKCLDKSGMGGRLFKVDRSLRSVNKFSAFSSAAILYTVSVSCLREGNHDVFSAKYEHNPIDSYQRVSLFVLTIEL